MKIISGREDLQRNGSVEALSNWYDWKSKWHFTVHYRVVKYPILNKFEFLKTQETNGCRLFYL